MRLAGFVLVLAVAALAFLTVAAGYVVWIRLVGLDPTLARRAAALPDRFRAPLALGLGLGLGTVLAVLPTVRAGLAAVVMLAAAVFAGLLLFELVAAADAHEA